MDFSRDFIALACRKGVLRFGAFVTKAGRNSPYFFNAGLFDDGASFRELCGYYARAIRGSGVACDMLFGPAYKGIPLVVATAVSLARDHGVDIAWCFNRKEAKDHGEGGNLIGAKLAGRRVLVVDDVITAGTAIREALAIIAGAGGTAAAIAIALDRQERVADGDDRSAAQAVADEQGIPVIAIAGLADLLAFAGESPTLAAERDRLLAYRARHGSRTD